MKFALSFVAFLSFADIVQGSLVSSMTRDVCDDETARCADSDAFVCELGKCKIKADKECTNTTECLSGATCPRGICECGSTFTSKWDHTACVLKEGQPCIDDGAECLVGASCKGNTGSKKCTCPENTMVNENKDTCLVFPGGECALDSDCAKNSECASNECVCRYNYTGDDTTPCKLKLKQECADNADCYGENAECKAGARKMCMCKTGFTPDGVRCVKKVGEACWLDKACPINAGCKAWKCECNLPAQKNDKGLCNMPAWANACEKTDDCPAGYKCADSKCRVCTTDDANCGSGRFRSTSGSSAVVGSVLMLLVAYVTSHLL